MICDNDHFSSSWTEKQYLVPGEYIPGQRETREQCAITAPASTQQGARQGPAAFMARESTVHTHSARMWGICLIKRTNQGVYMMLGLPSVQEGSGTIVFKQHPCCSAGSSPCRCTSAPLRAEGLQGQGPHFALHHLLILLMLHYWGYSETAVMEMVPLNLISASPCLNQCSSDIHLITKPCSARSA